MRMKAQIIDEDAQVTSNVPKAWFLVLGCNRQEGETGGAQGLCPFVQSLAGNGHPLTDRTSMSAHLLIGFQKTEVVVDVGH